MEETYAVKAREIVAEDKVFYAHKKEGKESELLEEHIERCLYYFHQLGKYKNFDKVFSNFRSELLPELSKQGVILFDKMLVNVIAFHDMGKINPLFQQGKMDNAAVKQDSICSLTGANHSLLSSAIYIDYFFEEIQNSELSKEEKEKLYVMMIVNAYIVSRHHGGLTEFETFLDEFNEGGKLYGIFEEMSELKFAAIYQGPFCEKGLNQCNLVRRNSRLIERFFQNDSSGLGLYTYIRFLFSILVSCDYYATTEYETGTIMNDFGNVDDIDKINTKYEESQLLRTIRKFDADDYEDDGKDINILRKCMFYEVENNLIKHKESFMYYIEAPTGGGKSNLALNCSLKLLDNDIRRIIYVYPFNTLVEQNYDSLRKIFGDTDVFQSIAVINSITPIKTDSGKRSNIEDSSDEEDNSNFYQKALLDRQFLNYPFILTTHVNLFQTMFGTEKEAAISFYQLSGSVIVLDEIQSYKNEIWAEIMMFLECFSRLLNMKVIIMSATLPKLDLLTENRNCVVNLIKNPLLYFEDRRFKDRVNISYELIHSDRKTEEGELYTHILSNSQPGKRILVEFIKKKRAEDFYWNMKKEESDSLKVLLMTGDDNQIERKNILKQIAESKESQCIVLIATQVIEAGVDIDMDIGYKDISKLDSDEQFLGRINRNFRRSGVTYFFDMDSAGTIYGRDFRINEQYTLQNENMRTLLERKDFNTYYMKILEQLRNNRNNSHNENGLEYFQKEQVEKLKFGEIAKRMKLIDDDKWDLSVYMAREIKDEAGEVLNGMELWKRYKELLSDQVMDYAQKQIELSEVRSKMNNFIYRFRKNADIQYNDRIGELYCVENADDYFADGKLNKDLLLSRGALFID